jgi:hypothetical protein
VTEVVAARYRDTSLPTKDSAPPIRVGTMMITDGSQLWATWRNAVTGSAGFAPSPLRRPSGRDLRKNGGLSFFGRTQHSVS